MTWLQRYRLRRFLGSSLVLFPLAGMLMALLATPVFEWVDHRTGWRWFGFTHEGARAVLGAFSSSMLTFIVFVLSAMLIVVQIASAQLTPRIIVAAFSKPLVRIVLTIFTFSYIYTIATLGGIEESVPQLPVAVTIGSNLACLVVFVRFVQQFGTGLRPLAVLQDVAQQGRTAIEAVYPQRFDAAREQTR